MTTITEIKQRNKDAGLHFFDRDTMRFFRSRILPTVYEGPGGVYFVTSEQFEFHWHVAPRKYTVTQAMPDGSTERASEFNTLTRPEAITLARKLAKGSSGRPVRVRARVSP